MIESPLLSKSIHQRFLVVALFPLLLTITLLTLYTIDARRGDLSENLYQSGEMTSDYQAQAGGRFRPPAFSCLWQMPKAGSTRPFC